MEELEQPLDTVGYDSSEADVLAAIEEGKLLLEMMKLPAWELLMKKFSGLEDNLLLDMNNAVLLDDKINPDRLLQIRERIHSIRMLRNIQPVILEETLASQEQLRSIRSKETPNA